jgi:hypothetical protein
MSTALALNDQPASVLIGEFATPDDVQRQFATKMTDLFLLALLLTANADKAQHCLIQSIRECLERDTILKGWLPAWIRNTVIRNAVRIVRGTQREPQRKESQPELAPSVYVLPKSAVGVWEYSAGILELSDCDRLAYVICVLENYSSLDCALLLGRSRQEVCDFRSRALAQVAAFERECCPVPHEPHPCHSSPGNDQPDSFDSSCGCLLD